MNCENRPDIDKRIKEIIDKHGRELDSCMNDSRKYEFRSRKHALIIDRYVGPKENLHFVRHYGADVYFSRGTDENMQTQRFFDGEWVKHILKGDFSGVKRLSYGYKSIKRPDPNQLLLFALE